MKLNSSISPPCCILFFSFTFFLIQQVHGKCEPEFSCGTINQITYPFSRNDQPNYCGHPDFNLNCQSDNITINVESVTYNVIEIDPVPRIMKLARRDLSNNICLIDFINSSFDSTLFSFTANDNNDSTLFYDCDPFGSYASDNFQCPVNQSPRSAYFIVDAELKKEVAKICKWKISIPVSVIPLSKYLIGSLNLSETLKEGFELHWLSKTSNKRDVCFSSGGECRYNRTTANECDCFCGGQVYDQNCPDPKSLPAHPPASLRNGPAKKRTNMKLKVVFAVSITVSVLLVLAVLLVCRKIRKRLKKKDYGEGRNEEDIDIELPLFDFNTIVTATDNFSSRNKLGQGGYGPVYKGVLVDGGEIAVKRLSETSDQGLLEFKNEVKLIAKLQHRNLVKLIGCCIEQKERMLVYEYLPNKSLNFFIFDKERRMLLDWSKRYNIINGIARGLLYLHQDSRLRIIHRDLKASNVLLDHELNPKISDFGMARTFGGGNAEISTNRVVGTYGYMSPEYQLDGRFSIKSDVFSFGVTVLEIVSSNRNRGFCSREHELNLLGHAWKLYREERPFDLIDESIKETCRLSEVLRSIHVGLLCVQHKQEDRPNMSAVVQMLTSKMDLPQPNEPGFYIKRDLLDSESSSRVHEIYTINELTITSLESRE